MTDEHKWFPYQESHLNFEVLCEMLKLVPTEGLANHGAVTEVLFYERKGVYFLRFEDGALSEPLESMGSYGAQVEADDLYLLGVLKDQHMAEMGAERRAWQKKKEDQARRDRQTNFFGSAQRRAIAHLEARIAEIRRLIASNFTEYTLEQVADLRDEAREKQAEIARIKALPPDKLLTSEEFARYVLLGRPQPV